MQSLAAHSPPKRRRPWILAVAVLVVVAAGAGIAFAVTGGGGGGGAGGGGAATGGSSTTTGANGVKTASDPSKPLTIVSTTPPKGTKNVTSNSTITVRFSAPLGTFRQTPTLSPTVSGTWSRTNATTLTFEPTAPFMPSATETLTIPGGPHGIVGSGGQHLATTTPPVTFTVAQGSTARLQQLLGQLGFLPLSYVEPSPAPAPQDMALPQPGTLAWRWAGMPTQLTSLWTQGEPNEITKAAIESFENQNGLTVDGLAGPKVWAAVLADVASGKGDTTPWDYVLVTKTLPQHLTLWVNGAVKYGNIAVNTGAPGADTVDGSYAVFEHVKASDMKGTNVTGSTYNDPTVPWASYFNGGDALHGFPRAHYGYPQSNGCVEMPITTAGNVWPYTPIGTLVTVVGPAS